MREFLPQLILSADQNTFYFWTALLAVGTLLSLINCLRHVSKARLVEDIPTSKIRSAAQGYVELEGSGRVLPDSPIISPTTGKHCLWWMYVIEKKVVSNRRTRWKVVEKKASEAMFILEDDTGDCLIDPAGADVHPSHKRKWYGRSRWPARGPNSSPFSVFATYRYHEHLILEQEPLYALGLFRTQRASDGHFDESSEVSALMREWKEDHEKMLKTFDTDKDGQISAIEWEAARRVALKKVREIQLNRAVTPGLHVLCKPESKQKFLISTRSQEEISRHYRRQAAFMLLLFLIGSGGLALMLTGRGLI